MSILGRWVRAVFCILTLFARAQDAKPRVRTSAMAVPMKTFTDRASGVSFTYPAAWTLAHATSFYAGSEIAPDGAHQPAQAVVSFSSRGNYYETTNLSGLEFTFVAVPELSQERCYRRVGKDVDPAEKPPETVSIHGRRFLHLSTGDAGMCHQAQRDIYQTYENGSCYLFEATTHTLCAGVVDGTHELTPSDRKALHRHLDAIIQTVRINPPQ